MKLSMAGAITDAVFPAKKYSLEEKVFLSIIGSSSIEYVLSFLKKGEDIFDLSITDRKMFFLFIAESIS